LGVDRKTLFNRLRGAAWWTARIHQLGSSRDWRRHCSRTHIERPNTSFELGASGPRLEICYSAIPSELFRD
jgi:hypothetical protein